MNDTEAIQRIKEFGLHHAIQDLPHSSRTVEAFETAIQALQEKAARENPIPLTLEQLKERVGRPVYAQSELLPGESHWCILDETLAFGGGFTLVAIYGRNLTLAESDYGRTWFAYDHEPKEV
ncbi:hypothetical protein [Aminipila luticellarii]|uniref:Uncharacterized protein n=1 Tax=Aminipila luticellarii TaxID=2507160 RepID=A0A410PWY7_9FIRM|nr:hypothetical protein [Aminipila luticellarii]QAT43458.1 hypothetical protein EQM06_09645 [Aminipila luticellarii]